MWSYWMDEDPDYEKNFGSAFDRVSHGLATTAILGIIPMWLHRKILDWLIEHEFVGNLPKSFHRIKPEEVDEGNPYDQERQFVYEELCRIYGISPKGKMAELQFLTPLEQERAHG